MATNALTFGKYISNARKAKHMSQKELASCILREDNVAISPQYLNDIEHDRRQPTSDHLIEQFAKALQLSTDYLHFLAGVLPEEIRKRDLTVDDVANAFKAFRKDTS
jgi:transcriptional regulator with XRE-family HTH domain